MKKQNSIYLPLVIILIASLACNIGGEAPSTEVEQEPTAGSGKTSPVATTVPTQEAGSNDGSASTETTDLTNPALYIIPGAIAYKYESTIKYTGVDITGGTKEISDILLVEVQTQPQITQHVLSSSEGDVDNAGSSDAGSINILKSDTVIIGDQMTSAQMVSVNGGTPELFCHTGLASNTQGPGLLESTLQYMPKIQDLIAGQAPRVESGIEVNGFVTDKYELSSENLVGDAGLISAFVYVARDGGFITLFESQHREKTKVHGFDPNQFTDIATTFSYILVEDGSLNIAIPAECNK
jgi:hypothetical protein